MKPFNKKNIHQKTEQSKDKKNKTTQSLPLSLITIIDNNETSLSILFDSLSKIKTEHLHNFECIIIDNSNNETISQTIQNNSLLVQWQQNNQCIIIKNQQKNAINVAIKEAIAKTQKNHIIIVYANWLKKSFNFNELLTFKYPKSPDLLTAHKIIFSEKNNNKKESQRLWILNKKLADYLNTINCFNQSAFDNILPFVLNELSISFETNSINQQATLEAPKKNILFQCLNKLIFIIKWLFYIPLTELRKSNLKLFPFINESSLFRFLFAISLLAIFIILPIISWDAGISGDESRHYQQAEKVYNFFKTFGQDTSCYHSVDKLEYYGQSFDFLTLLIEKKFNIKNRYEMRHVFNGLTGALTILFTGLLCVFLMGYRTGVIAVLLLFFSPRFLGHSMNNPLDVPFAMGFIFTLYFTFRMLKKLPNISYKNLIFIAIGIALTMSIRVGGLMLIPYIFFFTGIYFLFNSYSKHFISAINIKIWLRTGVALSIVSILGYIGGIIFWPYAMKAPINNVFESLAMMTNITTSLRVMFEGKVIWSNMLPWYYIPKFILVTVPAIVFIGLILFIILIPYRNEKFNNITTFLLIFSFVFPIVYVIYKGSNVYGGWRHLLFIYPSIIVATAIGFETLFRIIKKQIIKYAIVGFMLLLSIHPIKFILKNHPLQYTYFNELVGGIDNVVGYYETDYYLASLKLGSDWLAKNVNLNQTNDGKKTRILTNGCWDFVQYYLRNYPNVQAGYTRYYERGEHDWDYAIFYSNYIDPYQLKNKIWPPKGTIYTVNVDNTPVCAVVKRNDKSDYEATQALKKQDIPTAIALYEKAITYDPANETALLNLSEIYTETMQFDKALNCVEQCLKIYPNYDKALNQKGIIYLSQNKYNEAIEQFNKTLQVNFKYTNAYFNLAIAYLRTGQNDNAIPNLQACIENSPNFKPAYQLIGEILKAKGQTELANRYFEVANQLR